MKHDIISAARVRGAGRLEAVAVCAVAVLPLLVFELSSLPWILERGLGNNFFNSTMRDVYIYVHIYNIFLSLRNASVIFNKY